MGAGREQPESDDIDPDTHLRMNGSDRPISKTSRTALASNAHVPSIRIPSNVNIAPSTSACDHAGPRAGWMNRGSSDRKNSATFGLRVFTITP